MGHGMDGVTAVVEMASGMTESAMEVAAAIAGTGAQAGPPAPTYEGDFVLEGHLLLECGRTLAEPTLHYAVYGKLSETRDNVVLVCHALSGSAIVAAWWPELFGSGVRAESAGQKQLLRFAQDDKSRNADVGPLLKGAESLDQDDSGPPASGIVDLGRDCVVCVNLLGSCYGSTGPGSVDPETGEVYGPTFPLISIRDNVRAQALLLDSLGIEQLRLVIGGSIGGMQALDWAILFPERVRRAAVIAVAPLSAMGLALNHLAAAGDLGRSGLAGREVSAAEATAAGIGAGAANCDAELQVSAAI